jgi:hypothetical protein
MFAEFALDGSRIGGMAVCGDPIRCDAGHCLGRSETCLGGSKVEVLAEHDVDQCTVANDCRFSDTRTDDSLVWSDQAARQ